MTTVMHVVTPCRMCKWENYGECTNLGRGLSGYDIYSGLPVYATVYDVRPLGECPDFERSRGWKVIRQAFGTGV